MRCGQHAARTHVQTFCGTVTFQSPHWFIFACAGMSSTTLHQRRRKRKSGGSSEKRKGSQGYPATLVWTPRGRTCGPYDVHLRKDRRPFRSLPFAAVLVSANDIARRYRRATDNSSTRFIRLSCSSCQNFIPAPIPQPLSPPRTTCSDGISLARGSWHQWLSSSASEFPLLLEPGFLFRGILTSFSINWAVSKPGFEASGTMSRTGRRPSLKPEPFLHLRQKAMKRV